MPSERDKTFEQFHWDPCDPTDPPSDDRPIEVVIKSKWPAVVIVMIGILPFLWLLVVGLLEVRSYFAS